MHNRYNNDRDINSLIPGWLPVVLVVIAVSLIIYGTIQDKIDSAHMEVLADKIESNEQEKLKADEENKQKILEEIPGIVCWGDSLTAGTGGDGTTYPDILEGLIHNNIYNDLPVINMGVSGEDTNTIIGRTGAVPFVVDSFTIPDDLSTVNISLKSSNGNAVAPLRQGDIGVNPVTINGVEGTITIEQESITSKKFNYYFKRNTPGNSVTVDDGTQVITAGSKLYKDYINIIFMGLNGGWKTSQDLISQQKSIIDNSGKNEDKYLILGLTTKTKYERQSLEKKMVDTYGDKYINLREYLSTDGLKDAGITPTKEDNEAMEKGSIPPSLLSDKYHFNAAGYKLIGNIVYKRMVQLGYFDSIKDYLK